jgi:hypothetical protein
VFLGISFDWEQGKTVEWSKMTGGGNCSAPPMETVGMRVLFELI